MTPSKLFRETYNGNFTYAATEDNSLTVEGGYTASCASRVIDPANTVLDGGGTDHVLALVRETGAADFSVEGLTLQNGNATAETKGGGLYTRTTGHVTLTNNTFTGNTAKSSGGGAYVRDTSTLTDNRFTENTSGDNGGGIYYSSINSLTLTNNTISENTASSQGGGIWVKFISNSYTGKLYNNIIWSNTSSEASDLYIDNTGDDPFFPVPVDLFNNDFDQSASGTYMAKPFAIDSSNLNNADPLFVSSGNYHLTASSPCINTGNNAAPSIPATDKDGNPRITGGTVDMGAYEYNSSAPISNAGQDQTVTPGSTVTLDERIITKIEGDFGREIGSDMRLNPQCSMQGSL